MIEGGSMNDRAGILVAVCSVIFFIVMMGWIVSTSPERPCLHAPSGCKNATRNFSGYCDDCLNDWGPGI